MSMYYLATTAYIKTIISKSKFAFKVMFFYGGSFEVEERALDLESEDLGLSPDSATH